MGIDVIAVRGGEGGWIGTAFLTCPEADTPAESRQAVIEVATTDTVWSRVFDIGPVRSGPENDVTPARYRVGVR